MVATDKKISALSEQSAMATGDYLVAVDDPAGTPSTRYITYDTLFQGISIDVGIGRTPTTELDVYKASGACQGTVESGDNSAVLNVAGGTYGVIQLTGSTQAAYIDLNANRDTYLIFREEDTAYWYLGHDATDQLFKINNAGLGTNDVLILSVGRLSISGISGLTTSQLELDAATGNDAFVEFKENAVTKYSLGYDATDGGFKITDGNSPSAGTELFEVSNAGEVTSFDDFYIDGNGAFVSEALTNKQRFRFYGTGSGSNDYGIGMDATDLVVFFGAGGGCRFKTNDYDGTEIGRIYQSTGISTAFVTAAANVAELFLQRTGSGAQDWKIRCGQTGGNLSFVAASSTVASLGNNGVFTVTGNIQAGSDGTGVFVSSDGSSGVSGSFTTTDGKTVTVKDGIITAIV